MTSPVWLELITNSTKIIWIRLTPSYLSLTFISSSVFKELFFGGAALGSQQNGKEGIEISHIAPTPQHMHSLLYYQHP